MMLAALTILSIKSANGADDLLKDVTIGGHLDLYYQYSFNRPGVRQDLAFRQLDVRHDSFSLAALQLNILRKATEKNPFGFNVQLSVGKNTDLIHVAEPGGQDRYKLLQQAYVTYAVPSSGATIDFGKFCSWIGYETVISPLNDLYSISFLFYFAQPTYHTGFRASSPIGAGATASLYLVNGWNEVEDSNGSKSYGATLSVPVGSRTTVTANYYGGVEGSSRVNGFFGTAGGGQTALSLGDLIVIHQLTPKVKLALNADYGNGRAVDPGDPSGTFRGFAAYARVQATNRLAASFRYESVSDPDGLRSGANSRFGSISGSLEYATSPSALFRLELRADNANRDVFEGDNGSRKTRTTLTLAHLYKF